MKEYFRNKLAYFKFATIVAVLSIFLVPHIVSAGTVRLGGMDLNQYCNAQGQGNAVLNNNTWSCQNGSPITMTTACRWQYQNNSATAAQDVPNNPYSWSCYREDEITPTANPTQTTTPTPTVRLTSTPTSTQTRLGGMNLDGYCRNQSRGGAQLVNNVWQCQTGGAISLNTACQWQYTPSATAVQEVTGNPYTWACYSSTTGVTPTSAVTPTVSPTATATPTPTTALRVRPNIYSLTPDQLRRFVNAINTLRADGTIQRFSDMHMQAMMTESPPNDATTFRNVAHRGPAFLPWHREFINEFEQQLRRVDPTVTLPYWQFENESAGTPRVFSAAYFGSDGNRNQGDRVTDGPFADWGIVRRLGRDPDGRPSLPPRSDITTAMNNTIYHAAPYNEHSAGFNMAMEGWTGNNAPWNAHNGVHGYIGGDMITMSSADDPIFWVLHANVDRLWWQWQLNNGVNTFQPVSGGPAGHNLNDTMRFLLRPATPASTLDIRSLGYTYDQL